ncbi:MAG: hypothetical protein ACREK8_06335 [Gemmatimonadales bacterium]
MKRSHSGVRYLPWLARDAMLWPGRFFGLAIVGVSLLVWRFAARMHLPRPDQVRVNNRPMPMVTDISQLVQVGVWNTCLTVAILMTVGTIIGTDLERGYFRSWFSKPMSPFWFYLQRFLIGAVVILLCPLVLGIGLMLATGGSTGVTADLIGQIALAYLLVGSAAALASRFMSKGYLVVFLLSVMQNILHSIATRDFLPGWALELHRLLPPFYLLQPGLPVPHGGELWHIVGYGGGMLLLVLVLLRSRPLGSGLST